MSRKVDVKPRKTASQRRSRATVDALVEATARVLVKHGYAGANTNRIAEVAGISVGSLYQYFPSKEALVAAVTKRHADRILRVVNETYNETSSYPFELGIREFIRAAIAAHRVESKLHRILDEEAPRVRRKDSVDTVGNAHALVRNYLEVHRGEIGVRDLDLAAFILVTTVEALSHSAVLYHPEMLANERADAFVEEVTGLVLRYLCPGRTDGSAPCSSDPKPGDLPASLSERAAPKHQDDKC